RESERQDDECEVDRPVLEPERERARHRHGDPGRDDERAERRAEPRAHVGRGVPRPSRTARSAALVRSFTWSLRKILATWFFTVCSLMKRRRPISRFDSPVA